MTKRRLTKQQQARIQRSQKTSKTLSADEHLGPEQTGLVLSHYGQTIEIESTTGVLFRCFVRKNAEDLVAGDKVTWCPITNKTENTGIVISRLPRHSLLKRVNRYKQNKALAANIDQVIVVFALKPFPSRYYLDQYLVAAEITKIKPILVLNKIDLITKESQTAVTALLDEYKAIGYPSLQVSAKTQDGLAALQTKLLNKNSVLLGQSGVGKSSLINQLFDHSLTKVQSLSSASQKGQHTTSASTVYHLSGGGDIIDAPGIRDFGLWDLSDNEIASGFIEFQPLLSLCQFRNCTHQNEQGCAIQKAHDEGKILPFRLASYHRMINED